MNDLTMTERRRRRRKDPWMPLALLLSLLGVPSVASSESLAMEKSEKLLQNETLLNEPRLQGLFERLHRTANEFRYGKLLLGASERIKQQPNYRPVDSALPVMVGRRRAYLEQTMHSHYQNDFLSMLRDSDTTATDEGNNETVAFRNETVGIPDHEAETRIKVIHASLKAYLFQDELDANSKINPDYGTSSFIGLPPFPPSRRKLNKQVLKDMFQHAYDSYMTNAFPAAEVKPITCENGVFDLIRLPALTLIDSLDTLLIMGNATEFAKSVERLRQLDAASDGIFNVDENVSLFETNIRIVGGLLSAHQLALAFLPKFEPIYEQDIYVYSNKDPYLKPPPPTSDNINHGDDDDNNSKTCKNSFSEDQTSTGDASDNSYHDTTCNLNCDTTNLIKSCLHSSRGTNSGTIENKTRSLKGTTRMMEWKYDGFLLELALDMGIRLLPAFDTRTGIPYGTVNLLTGIPQGETTVASLAGGGTLSLEMELLTRLSGDERFGKAAKLATRALFIRRSAKNLLGKHIGIRRGLWTETVSGIGSNSDSFYEYLVKHYLLYPEDSDFWTMLLAAYDGVFSSGRYGEWYADSEMSVGVTPTQGRKFLESLMAFYPGMQTLLGETVPAARSLNSFFMVREYLGFLPERFNYGRWKTDGGITAGSSQYPLRPELLESCYFMHRATQGMHSSVNKSEGSVEESTSGWLWAADFSLHHLERLTRAKCGYASVKKLAAETGVLRANAEDIDLYNEMPSFFLSETIKYLFLAFDEDNLLHNDQDREWIFTTEAHPIHHVEPVERKLLKTKKLRTEKIKEKLKEKLMDVKKHRLDRTESSFSIAPQSGHDDLDQEKWSAGTESTLYDAHLKKITNDATLRRTTTDPSDEHKFKEGHLLNMFGYDNDLVQQSPHFRSSFEEPNQARMSLTKLGLGSGYMLRKECPNLHSPDLLWVHALSGGTWDYADVYVSSLSDSDVPPVFQLSALEALKLLGTGVYLGKVHNNSANVACFVDDASDVTIEGEKSSGQSSPIRGETLELDGLGEFEISAFPEGSGFFMRSMKTGESVMATFIVNDAADDNDSSSDPDMYVMVYSIDQQGEDSEDKAADENIVATSTWRLMGPRLASFFKPGAAKNEKEEETHKGHQRSVVMADFSENSFICEIAIMSRTSDESEEDLLGYFPCAPALFGPSHIANLRETGGVTVEHVLSLPDDGNEYGCKVPVMKPSVLEVVVDKPVASSDEESAEDEWQDIDSEWSDLSEVSGNPRVQLVHRGRCNFRSKATNLKATVNAEGVIVMNSEQDDLFIMSDVIEDQVNSFDEVPTSVLVTGRDGAAILRIVEDYSIAEAELVAKISLRRQQTLGEDVVGPSKDSDIVDWPIVRGSSESLQIFASGGWGIHAVPRTSGDQITFRTRNDWQIYLVRHSK